MGQREPIDWDDQLLVWGEDAAWAHRQATLHSRMHHGEGRPMLKAEQLAAFDLLGGQEPTLARQYDRFGADQWRCVRGQ